METRANNALIGLFTLAVLAAAFGFVYWFARAADGNSVQRYRIVFSGSITGLSVGSSVLFNGIRVGQVDSLEIDGRSPAAVIGRISVRTGTPIKVDTRAGLEFQGLTGGAFVQLTGGSPEAPDLKATPPDKEPTLFAEKSQFQNLVDGARDTVARAGDIIARVDHWLQTNEKSLTSTVDNVRTFSQALSDNSKNISDFLASTGDAARSITTLSNNLNGMTDELDALLKSVDPKKVTETIDNVASASAQIDSFMKALDTQRINTTLENVEAFSKTLAETREPLAAFARDAAGLTAKLDAMAPKLEAGLDSFNKVAGAIDSEAVARTVSNIDKVAATLGNNATEIEGILKDARTLTASLSAMTPKLEATFDGIGKVTAALDGEKIGRVVDNVDKFAASLGGNTDKVDAFIKDASEIGQKLNASADRIDGILKNIEGMTTSSEGKGMFVEITATARAIRDLAEKLDARTAAITAGITEFTGSGLRDYKQLAVDGQKALRSIDRTLKSLERDPQQVLFGPRSSIPEFRGQ